MVSFQLLHSSEFTCKDITLSALWSHVFIQCGCQLNALSLEAVKRQVDGCVSGQSSDFSKHLSYFSSLLPIWFLTTHLSDFLFSFISCFHNSKELWHFIKPFSNHFWQNINQKSRLLFKKFKPKLIKLVEKQSK